MLYISQRNGWQVLYSDNIMGYRSHIHIETVQRKS
jgi:hypothetical protein